MYKRFITAWFACVAFAFVVVLALGFSAAPARASFGFESLQAQVLEEGGAPAMQAGSHPYEFTTTIYINHRPGPGGGGLEVIPDGDVKDLVYTLPPGLTVNLLGVERCTEVQFSKAACPAASAVGTITLHTGLFAINNTTDALYNIVPSSPRVPGELGFDVSGLGIFVHLIGRVSTGGDYALGTETPNIQQIAALYGATVTLWGDPYAKSHDRERGPCANGLDTCPSSGEIAVTLPERPFLTLPSSCGTPLVASVSADSWQEPGVWTAPFESVPVPAMTGCGRPSFTPSLEVKPETGVADTPTGIRVRMSVPQNEEVDGLAEANLKEALVTLPSGLVVSPSTVSGMGACSEAEIELNGPGQPSCPESSKIASVEIVTPLLEHSLHGAVYVAQQGNGGAAQGSNPFGSLVAMYLVAEGSGVLFKTAGEVQLNQSTGQLTARFGRDPLTGQYLPQIPFSELELNFFGGPRAPLVPEVCGSYTTTSVLTPWSAPQSGPPATPQSSFDVNSSCATGAFNPSLTAGTTSNQAGGYSPFTVTFARQDGEQEFGAIQVHTPPGLLGSISHVPLCGEPQAEDGTCGSESEIGEVSAAVGPGPYPFYVAGGRAYLTGPYKGAPFGLSFVVPATGGPFNLGNVIVRAAISVDLRTSALTITSNALPTILQGVPLQVRSVTVNVNRPEFMFNSTSCEHRTISATLQGSLGASTTDSVPYQAGDCAALAFKPTFAVSTSGETSRTDGASLDVRLSYPSAPQGNQANIAKVKVDLPKQLPARLTTLQRACPAVTFEADPAACPSGSTVGIARATTPLLPVMLGGPAYFVSYGGAKFPELIVVLQGDNVRVDLHGETFINKTGITSSTFNAIPDVPVGTFELYLPEGPDSALAANGNLCTSTLAMPTAFVAQNGTEIHESTKIAVTGCPKAKAAQKKKTKQKGKKARNASHRHGKTGGK
jgi:hypothetical protein